MIPTGWNAISYFVGRSANRVDQTDSGRAPITGSRAERGIFGRQEVAIGTERLFTRLPNLRLDGEVELHGFEFRGPKALRVRWDV